MLDDTVKNQRLKEIFERLKDNADYSEIMLVESAQSWRFSRKIPIRSFGLVADNDDTMTTAGKKNRSWIMLQAALRSMGKISEADEVEKLRLRYRNIEETIGPLSAQQMHEWHEQNLDIFIRGGLTLSALEEQVRKDSEMYPEAIGLLKYLLDSRAAVCIVSAGIAEIIRLALKKQGIDPARYDNLRIFAIELGFSREGVLNGYLPHTIVTLENKGPLAREFMVSRGIADENVIGIGDGLTDVKMLEPFSDKVSMVLFCPAHKIGDLKESNFLKISSNVHAVIKKDFGVFAELIKEMTS